MRVFSGGFCGLRVLLGLCVLLGCVLCLVSVAWGGVGFSLGSSFGSPEGFVAPAGLAVDNSVGLSKGDVYVSDGGRGVVEKFTAGGGFVAGVVVPGGVVGQVAVDDFAGPGEGDVLVVGQGAGVVYRYSSGFVLDVKGELKGLVEPTAVAVDEAGDVFVAEFAGNPGAGKVLEFNAAGEPINAAGALTFGGGVVEGLDEPLALAVSANGEDLYVASTGGVFQYTISGSSYVQTQMVGATGARGVSLDDASGNVYVDGGGEVSEYEASGALVSVFGAGTLSGAGAGVGVDSASGEVYVADSAAAVVDVFEPGETPAEPTVGTASSVMGTTAVLEGTLNAGGGGVSGYYFQYSTGPSCAGGATSIPEAGTSGPVHSEVSGLAPHTSYTFCLVATNKYGSSAGPAAGFETGSVPPSVEGGSSFSRVTPTSASVTTQVNLGNSAGSYYYEYASGAGQPQRTAEASLPASPSPLAAPAQLTGLQPHSEYHFRLVVKNTGEETAEGAVVAFTTLPASTAGLPDGRAYEMVTPAENNDASVYIPETIANSVSLGEGVPTRVPVPGLGGWRRLSRTRRVLRLEGLGPVVSGWVISILRRARPTGGWTQEVIQPPGLRATYYQGFSSDLSAGVLNSGDSAEPKVPPLSPEAPGEGYSVLYKRTNSESASSTDEDPYHPLFTRTPPNRSASTFGTSRIFSAGKNEAVPVFGGGSAAFDRLAFEANDALLDGEGVLEEELKSNAASELAKGENGTYLYESVDGTPSLIGLDRHGKSWGTRRWARRHSVSQIIIRLILVVWFLGMVRGCFGLIWCLVLCMCVRVVWVLCRCRGVRRGIGRRRMMVGLRFIVKVGSCIGLMLMVGRGSC